MKTVLCFLIKGNKILLAEKKRGFAAGKLNGVGGKIENGETPDEAMVRETQEEIFVTPTKYEKVAEIEFDEFYKGKPENNFMHVYFVYDWIGKIKESEEMKPFWFNKNKIPFDRTLPDDEHWFPHILAGKKVKGYFKFDENWNCLDQKIEELKTTRRS